MKRLALASLSGFLLLIALLSACAAPPQRGGISVSKTTTSVGASREDGEEQVYSYRILLENSSGNTIGIDWIEPVLKDSFQTRVARNGLRVTVNKTVAANTSLEVGGEFPFDARGLSKADIVGIEPIISGIRVTAVFSSGGKQ